MEVRDQLKEIINACKTVLRTDRELEMPSINKANLLKTINVLKRAQARESKFDLTTWYSNIDVHDASTEEDLHKCGTTACIMGWVAVSPEWKAAGGTIDKESIFARPAFTGPLGIVHTGYNAARQWFDLTSDQLDLLISPAGARLYEIDRIINPKLTYDQVVAYRHNTMDAVELIKKHRSLDADIHDTLYDISAARFIAYANGDDIGCVIDGLQHLHESGRVKLHRLHPESATFEEIELLLEAAESTLEFIE